MNNFLKTVGIIFLSVATTLILQSNWLSKLLPIDNTFAQNSANIIKSAEDMNQWWNTQPVLANKIDYLPYALPKEEIFSFTYNGKTGPIIIDMNGDGLSDLVYSERGGQNGLDVTQYVLLNTGEGFERVYSCKENYNNTNFTYTRQGACATN
ncbi:MAG: hypothetical protein Q8O95_05820 [bacterium]|nr:hypothetical protein [bacterium]